MTLNDVPSSDVRVVSTMSASSGRWYWCTDERCVRAIASAEPRTELAAIDPVTSNRPSPKRWRPSIPPAYAARRRYGDSRASSARSTAVIITPMALSPPRRSRMARARPNVVRGSIVVPPGRGAVGHRGEHPERRAPCDATGELPRAENARRARDVDALWREPAELRRAPDAP